MKLAPLLAQFLYQQKRLDLRGIGTFFLNSGVPSPEVSQQTGVIADIHFENNPSIQPSNDLIGFIAQQTGKMKALAAADLESHLEMVHQFLNIGKPFQLEGIGNIAKIRSGAFEFIPGNPSSEKMKEMPGSEGRVNEEGNYDPFIKKEKSTLKYKMPVMALLLFAGIGVAVTGGYILYKNNKGAKIQPAITPALESVPTVTADTIVPEKKLEPSPDPIANNQGEFKYVLEKASKKRAFERFSKLKTYRWNVEMETNDSLEYKLYVRLPNPPADTTRIIDSLTALNGRRVYLEN